jgi:hypothetical protein
VGDHVVELTGDATSLFCNRPIRDLLLLSDKLPSLHSQDVVQLGVPQD